MMLGSSAAMVGRSKATVAPMMVTATNMPAGVSQFCQVATASSADTVARINWQTRPMRRRSKRSATCPTMKVRTTIGRNWQRPTSARANALWV
jgi:hypothetical protein